MKIATLLVLALSLLIPGSLQAKGAAKRVPTVIPMESEPQRPKGRALSQRISVLEGKIRSDPRVRSHRLGLVRALMDAGRYPEALVAAQAWRAHDAYDLLVVRLMGDIQSEMGLQGEARRTYSAVVELVPGDVGARRALASVMKQSGDLEAAHEQLSEAVVLAPEDRRIVFELGDVAHRLGRLDEAAEHFEAIVRGDKVSEALRTPARQRLAQIHSAWRRLALDNGDPRAAEAHEQFLQSLHLRGGVHAALKVDLSWDTDRSDVDLWVINPAGERVFYSHKRGRFGGQLFHDVTTGYGPESFRSSQAEPGRYTIRVHYYGTGRRALTEARGEVTVVLDEGRPTEVRRVLPYRLFKPGQVVTVAQVEIPVEVTR